MKSDSRCAGTVGRLWFITLVLGPLVRMFRGYPHTEGNRGKLESGPLSLNCPLSKHPATWWIKIPGLSLKGDHADNHDKNHFYLHLQVVGILGTLCSYITVERP